MDVLIAQGLGVNAFTFRGQIMIGSFRLLEGSGKMSIGWNCVNFRRKFQSQNGSCADKLMGELCILLFQRRAGGQRMEHIDYILDIIGNSDKIGKCSTTKW